jgi:hypothetical protein
MSLSSAIRMLVQHPRIISGTVTANWNGGVATSGLAGADLFTYGQLSQWWRLQEGYFKLFPGVWNALAVITCRVYFTIMGAEQLIASEDWDTDGTDGNVAFIYWFWSNYEMYGPIRVELSSTVAADDGVTVPYELRVKDW